MTTERLARSEHITTSPEEVDQLFRDGLSAFYDLPFNLEFNELCVQRGIDPEDASGPEYWAAAADFSTRASDQAREAGEDERAVVLREVLATTPNFMYTQVALNRGRQAFPDRTTYDAARSRVSRYNSLVRHAVEQMPDLRASVLQKNILGIVNISLETNELRQAGARFTRMAVRGMQHEVAFGQLLAHTGRDFRPASLREDMKGADYVVETEPRTIFLDVKASLSEIEAKGESEKPYAIDPRDGQVTMYSLVTDRELNDRFYVTESVASQRAALLDGYLEMLAASHHETAYAG